MPNSSRRLPRRLIILSRSGGWRSSVPTASGSVMEPLEGNHALLDGERPLEDDDPYIALACDGGARLELGRGDPAVLIPHPAEQRYVCLPHHGHAPDLDRVLVLHWRSPFGVRAEHTWQRGSNPAYRRAAGL